MMVKIFFISIFWILVGIFAIFTRTFDTSDISVFNLSIDFVLSSTISIFSIVIGICFILRKRWAHKAMLYLSTLLIVGICGFGIKMITYGILEVIKFHSISSGIELFFGFITFISSIPFFLVIACINGKKIRGHFYNMK